MVALNNGEAAIIGNSVGAVLWLFFGKNVTKHGPWQVSTFLKQTTRDGCFLLSTLLRRTGKPAFGDEAGEVTMAWWRCDVCDVRGAQPAKAGGGTITLGSPVTFSGPDTWAFDSLRQYVKVGIIIIKCIICYISSIWQWIQTTKRPQKTTTSVFCSLSLVFVDATNFETGLGLSKC